MTKFLYDFVPVLLFFVVFHYYGIYAATLTGMVATALQVVFHYLWKRSFDNQQLLTLAVFMVFGSLTLYFHNPVFIKWKPTVIFWVMAVVFFGSQYVGQKPLIQRMMEKSLEGVSVDRGIWRRLTGVWTLFFAILGGINLLIAYCYSTAAWVNFKFYGISGLLLLFCFAQALYLSRYMTDRK